MRTRAIIGPLLGESADSSEEYNSLAEDLSNYEKILINVEDYDKQEMRDMKRDVRAALEGVRDTEDDLSVRSRSKRK